MSPRRITWEDPDALDSVPRAGAPRVSGHRAVPDRDVKPGNAEGDLPGTATVVVGGRHLAGPKPRAQGTEAAAAKLGIDLRSECPVCRDVDGGCSCEEGDREFVRRVRHEEDVKAVARCPRCRAPLSVVYLRRPGSGPAPHELSRFVAVWGCAGCAGDALASVALAEKGRGGAPELETPTVPPRARRDPASGAAAPTGDTGGV